VLTASLTLNGDVNCPSGAGLTVAGDNVVINLNGHGIIGNASAVGMHVVGNADTIENGLVEGWATGVLIDNAKARPSKATILSIRVEWSLQTGIQDSGSSTRITNSSVFATGSPTQPGNGILAENATGGTYAGDRELNNRNTGLYIRSSGPITVTGNFATGNLNYGIAAFEAAGLTLSGNRANNNGNDGINLDALDVTDGGGNTARGNDYTSPAAGPPEQCFGVAC
jgi:parallel beta-helix repeat protein